MKLAIAVQRYGADINGGAELHVLAVENNRTVTTFERLINILHCRAAIKL